MGALTTEMNWAKGFWRNRNILGSRMMSCQYTVLLVLFQGITNKINTNKDTSYCLSCHCQTMVLLSFFQSSENTLLYKRKMYRQWYTSIDRQSSLASCGWLVHMMEIICCSHEKPRFKLWQSDTWRSKGENHLDNHLE